MKLSFTKLIPLIALISFSFLTSSCKKNKKGVIETHTFTETVFGDIFEGAYHCYLIKENSVSLKDGELISSSQINSLDGSKTTTEYVYWEKKSASQLGYTEKHKLESKMDILGYTTKTVFATNANAEAGPNGYWGSSSSGSFSSKDIVGHWKHESSGLEIQINSGNSGSATVLETGTAFPPGADGGECMIDINYQSGNEWTGLYRTYYPNTGWQNSSSVIFYMENDKKSFILGGQTYIKI